MDNAPRHIVMVASENDALVGGKVGGVGDVIKGLSDALARKGRRVTTIIPAYGFLHKKNLSRLVPGILCVWGDHPMLVG